MTTPLHEPERARRAAAVDQLRRASDEALAAYAAYQQRVLLGMPGMGELADQAERLMIDFTEGR